MDYLTRLSNSIRYRRRLRYFRLDQLAWERVFWWPCDLSEVPNPFCGLLPR